MDQQRAVDAAKEPPVGPQPVAAAARGSEAAAAKTTDGLTPGAVAEQERKARRLLHDQNYDAAIGLLSKLAELQEPIFESTSTWARVELPSAKQQQQKLRERLAAACTKARDLLKEFQYGEAAYLLEAIPAAARTEQARQ